MLGVPPAPGAAAGAAALPTPGVFGVVWWCWGQLWVLVGGGFPREQPLVGEAGLKEGASAASRPRGRTRGAPCARGTGTPASPGVGGGLTVAAGRQVAMQSLWNIKVVVLVKPEHENRISHVSTSSVKTGIANTLGRGRGRRARGAALHRGGLGTRASWGESWCCMHCTRRGPGTRTA